MVSRKILFCGALLFLVSFLGAQEYYIERNEGETRIIQRLGWKADENAWRYEVEIEEFIRDEEFVRGEEFIWDTEQPKSAGLPEADATLAEADTLSESSELSWGDESLEDDELSEGGELSGGDESLEGDELSEGSGLSGDDAASVPDVPSGANVTETAKPAGTPEVAETGTFTGILRESTQDDHIDVSLPPGVYRYRVTAYDFLDRPGPASEWARLEILLALEPVLDDFSPRAFYLDGDAPWAITLTGQNMAPDAEVYLKQSGKKWVITPREYSPDDSLSEATLLFDVRQLVQGSYEIYVINPGGLDASTGTLEVGYFEKYDMYIGAVYMPLVSLYGKLGQLEKKAAFYPLGAALRFGIIPFKKAYGHFGLEISGVWNYLSSGNGDDKASYHVGGAELNVLYQKWLPNRVMALTFRVGGGLAGTTGMLLPRAEAGAAFLWLIRKPFYLEAGIDGVHWFRSSDSPGYLRPWLGGGIKL